MSSKENVELLHFRRLVAETTDHKGPRHTQDLFKVTRQYARYWAGAGRTKGQWGGARNFRYSEHDELVISNMLTRFIRQNPLSSLKECVSYCAKHGFVVDEVWVCRFWQRIDYTTKVASFKQKEKFTSENIR